VCLVMRVPKAWALVFVSLVLICILSFFTVGPFLFDKASNSFIPPPYEWTQEAEQVHQQLFIADLHADPLMWDRDLLDRHNYGTVDIPRLLEGNVALQMFTVVTKRPWNFSTSGGISGDSFDLMTLLSIAQLRPFATWISLKERALYQASKLHDTAQGSEGRLVVVKSREDLRRYVQQRTANKELVAALLGMEGVHSLEGKIENVEVFYDAGFRMMGLTHHFDNEVGTSGTGEAILQEKPHGLSEFGERVIQRMEELNMIVDLAHASGALIDDVLKIAKRPIIVSHTGVKGTCDGLRNLADEHLLGIAATRGVIGIGYWETAVCQGDVEAIVDAIEYTAILVGTEHVALGSDFDGFVGTPFDTTGIGQITDRLLTKRFSMEDIKLIMGENVLRVLEETLP